MKFIEKVCGTLGLIEPGDAKEQEQQPQQSAAEERAPRSARPSSSIMTSKPRVIAPVGSPIIGYLIFLIVSDASAQALWTKWVSVETE